MKASSKNKIVNSAKIKGLKLLKIGTVTVPIAAIIYSNLDKYLVTTEAHFVPQVVSLSVGGTAAVGVAVYAALSQKKLTFSWVFMGIIFGILTLIEPIIKDLVLFTGVAFAGMTFNHLFVEGAIENASLYGNMTTEALVQKEALERVERKRLKDEQKAKIKAERKAAKQVRYRP